MLPVPGELLERRGFRELTARFQAIPDTLPESPLPGGVAAVVRWFMHVPQPIQIGGAILAGMVVVALVALAWRRRGRIDEWIRTRRRGVLVALASGVALVAIAAASFGFVAYDYVQHDNDFCVSCHVMGPAYQRFLQSEHADLLCHDCHQQPLSASARQLYLWVLDRPEEIGPHAPVPNRVCAACHIREEPGERWERIAATAGHRVHLQSDDPELRGILCVTCHGQEVHEFVPADVTCGQAGCHQPAETRIVLGAMTEATGLHCVTCHEFTAIVPEDTPPSTAFGTLRPGESQCITCHDMQALLADFDPLRDPHDAACGMCHDPHTQEVPAAAFATCTAAGCHDRPAEESPFHRGIDESALRDCASCHQAHHWTVDGLNCVACHPEVAGAVGRSGRAVVLHSTSSMRGWRHPAAASGPPGDPRMLSSSGGAPVELTTARHVAASRDIPPGQDVRPFDHAMHRELECTECHSSARRHGEVVIGPADCFSCHHTPPVVERGCVRCHEEGELAGARRVGLDLQLGVWESSRRRSLPFDHAAHGALACGDCHLPATAALARECTDCHREHHGPAVDCMACHIDPPEGAHTVAVHLEGCAGAECHAPAAGVRYGALGRSRSFCLSCHQDQHAHEPGEVCVDCHLLPAEAAGGGPGGGAG